MSKGHEKDFVDVITASDNKWYLAACKYLIGTPEADDSNNKCMETVSMLVDNASNCPCPRLCSLYTRVTEVKGDKNHAKRQDNSTFKNA